MVAVSLKKKKDSAKNGGASLATTVNTVSACISIGAPDKSLIAEKSNIQFHPTVVAVDAVTARPTSDEPNMADSLGDSLSSRRW